VGEKPRQREGRIFRTVANELDKDSRKDTAMSRKKRRHSSGQRAFGTEMRIDPRFTRVGFLSIGIAMLLVTLYLFTGLDIFRWLTYFSGAVLIILTLVTLMVGIRRED
jgi:hypothetical protein